MSEHTKGRLDLIEAPRSNLIHIDLHEGDPSAPTVTGLFSITKKFKEIARRLVACWNACLGIETAHLEEYQDFGGLAAVVAKSKQRDELLAMLDRLCKVVPEPELVSMGHDSPPEHRNQEEFEIAYALHEARELRDRLAPKQEAAKD